MDTFLLAAASALWLGVLTSVSPCPLAGNIAAISFIGRRVGSTRQVLLAGLFYALGRLVTYLILGIVTVAGLLSIPGLSFFLQNRMNTFLGPILIVVGVILLGAFKFSFGLQSSGEKMQARVEKAGLWGAGLMGLVFALSFCPVTAALFFGSLIPLSVEHGSKVLFPSLYGLGTSLPVILCALVIAFSAQSVGKLFARLTKIELWARRITAVVFILVGVYYSLIYIFHFDI